MNVGEAIALNPGYLKLRKIRAAQAIAKTVSVLNFEVIKSLTTFPQVATSQNRVFLNAGSLMLNIADKDYDISATTIQPKRK